MSPYDNIPVPIDNDFKTSSSDPILFIQLVDQVLDPVAPMVNDEKLEHNNGSTFATLEITAPHSNEEAPSVDCEPIISRSQYPFRQATKYSSMECTGNVLVAFSRAL